MPLDDERFADFPRVRPVRELSDGEDYLRPVRDNIEKYGWHVQYVFAEPGRLGWAYTIGFWTSMGHPELVVFGLDQTVAQTLLNDIGDAIADGQTFADGQRSSGFLVDVDIEFRETLERWGPSHFGRASDWYGSIPSVLQVVIPDLENRFPGDPDEEVSRFQLLLANDSPAPALLTHPHTPFAVEGAFTVIVSDLLGGDETGWEERVVVVEGSQPDRFVVVSVPFVDHLAFGDEIEVSERGEELYLHSVTKAATTVTVRVLLLGGDEDIQDRFGALLDAAEENEIVWESPVQSWFFFGVPHHRLAWFREVLRPFLEAELVSARGDRISS